MLNYFMSDKSVALVPINENGIDRSFVQGNAAYTMIRKILKSNLSENEKQDELRFFTQWGKKKILGNTTIESTPSMCFNIYLGEKVFSTYPTHYMRILEAIDSGNEAQLKIILEQISNDLVNIKLITDYFPKAIVEEKEIIVNGKFGKWSLNRETMACSLNGNFVCIVFKGKYDKNPEFTQKEEIMFVKLLAMQNDELYYNIDAIIKIQVDRICKK